MSQLQTVPDKTNQLTSLPGIIAIGDAVAIIGVYFTLSKQIKDLQTEIEELKEDIKTIKEKGLQGHALGLKRHEENIMALKDAVGKIDGILTETKTSQEKQSKHIRKQEKNSVEISREFDSMWECLHANGISMDPEVSDRRAPSSSRGRKNASQGYTRTVARNQGLKSPATSDSDSDNEEEELSEEDIDKKIKRALFSSSKKK